jgi:hypothetical protein
MGGEHEPGVQRCELESDNLKAVPVGHRDPPSTGEGLLQVLVLLERKAVKPLLTATSEQQLPVYNDHSDTQIYSSFILITCQ